MRVIRNVLTYHVFTVHEREREKGVQVSITAYVRVREGYSDVHLRRKFQTNTCRPTNFGEFVLVEPAFARFVGHLSWHQWDPGTLVVCRFVPRGDRHFAAHDCLNSRMVCSSAGR
jgi:hypothetical protein